MEYISIIFLILCSHSVYFKQSTMISAFFEIALFLSFAVLSFRQLKGKGIVSSLATPLLLSAANLIPLILILLLNSENSISYTLQRIILLSGIIPIIYLYVSLQGWMCSRKRYLPRFVNIATFLCGAGIALWVLGQIKIVKPNVSIATQWGGLQIYQSYFGVDFLTQTEIGFGGVWRFTSIFVEAPLAGFFILTALCIELFLCPRTRISCCVVLSVAAFCTFSTTVMIFLPILLSAYCLVDSRIREKIRNNTFLTAFSILFIISFVFLAPLWAWYSVVNKTNIASLQAHISQTLVGIDSFMHSPIFGQGIGNYQDAFSGGGQTSGILSILAQGGILLFIPYFVALVKGLCEAFLKHDKCFLIFSFYILFELAIVFIDNSCLLGFLLAILLSRYRLLHLGEGGV